MHVDLSHVTISHTESGTGAVGSPNQFLPQTNISLLQASK